MDFLNGQLQVFLGPQENGASDDLEAVIVQFLDEAQFGLDVAVQEIDNPRIAAALDRAARRLQPGTTRRLHVRFVTEGDYLSRKAGSSRRTPSSTSTSTAGFSPQLHARGPSR